MSRFAIRSDRTVFPDCERPGFLIVGDSRILSFSPAPPEENIPVYDFGESYVLPGFVELHTHGAGGHPFLSSDPREIAAGCDVHLRHGATTVLPTVSAAPFPAMRAATAAVSSVKKDRGRGGPRIPGVHLEGPYLSEKQCGAQSTVFLTPPVPSDYVPLADSFPGDIARWTYAPEKDSDGSFCSFLRSRGILASAGHTDAVLDDMELAVASGCRLVTHLYSCTSTVTRHGGFRSPGVIESAFIIDSLYAELIGDGKHLPAELVKMVVKIKGRDRVILVSDCLDIAGTDIREGEMSGVPFIVEDGVCKLRSREAFAGSVALSDRIFAFAVGECGFSPSDASVMMSKNPAELIGLDAGVLAPGKLADITVVDPGLRVCAVFTEGRRSV